MDYNEETVMPVRIDVLLLLVETNTVAIEFCREIISRRFPQVTVHTASTTFEAIALFKVHRHEIVVSDLLFPLETGLQLAREIWSLIPDTFVLFLSGNRVLDAKALWSAAKDRCEYQIVFKPLDVRELLQCIDDTIAVIARRRTNCQASPA